MAKKAKTSARSKGYRKTVQKKPFLTKKEIIALVVIVAVIALAVILFNLLYDDGSLDVVDGVVQTENLENSLIATDVVGDETKYFKVGEAGEVAGYTRERVENTADANLATFDYYPEDETSPISYLHVGAGGGTPDALMQTVTLSYTMSGVPIDAQGETEIDGRAIQYMITSGEYAIEEEAAETEETAQTAEADVAETGEEPASDAATAEPETTIEPETTDVETAAETDETENAETADAQAETEETAPTRYTCQQILAAYVPSELNDDYSIALRVNITKETENAVDAEGLAAYTESIYLSEEELLAYLEQAMQAVFPAADAE